LSQVIRDKTISCRDAGSVTDLLGPRCGADNLHHLSVTFFARAEDAPTVTRARTDGFTTTMDTLGSDAAGNPSTRRDGISIQFQCEQCGGVGPHDVLELTIAQHKGSTEIGWRFAPRRAG
jgi:hypothetical protein